MYKRISPGIKRKLQAVGYVFVGVILCAVPLYCLRLRVAAPPVIDAKKITLAKVKQDLFQDEIAVIGSVEPIQTVYLDATEGGRVEEIFIREGTKVKPGDPILRISNDKLRFEISSYETGVARAVNDLKTLRISMQNQLYNNQSQLVQYYYDLCKLRRDQTNNELLFRNKIMSGDDYLVGRENYERKEKLYELLQVKSLQDSNSMTAQMIASEETVQSMQNNLAVNRARLDKLVVRAPVLGELDTLNPEIGKVINAGSPVGTINILDGYKIEAKVGERFITRVKPRLKAFCEFEAREYPATVAKIFPEVRDGRFSIHLTFSGSVPPDIRIGQTCRIRLQFGEPHTALLVPHGGFFASTGGEWIYVVNPEAQAADRRNIQIGRQNTRFYEVLDGLEPGETVITSVYDGFGNRDSLVLKNIPQ